MRDRIDAAAFALAVYAFLYVARGLYQFVGYSWWSALVWSPLPWSYGWGWRSLVFEHGAWLAVALLVYRLRLQGLLHNQDLVPDWVWAPIRGALKANATLTAVAVFAVLYLAVGAGVFVHGFTSNDAWQALTWPYQMFMVPQVVLVSLGAFAAVSGFVFILKLAFLETGEDYQKLERESGDAFRLRMELNACQQEAAALRARSSGGQANGGMDALREEVKELRGNLESSRRQAAEARMRAAEAEAELLKMRESADGSPPPGGAGAELAALRGEVKELRANLENARRQAAEARVRAAEAEAEVSKMRQNAGGSPPRDKAKAGRGGDEMFKQAKRAFARMYHPDAVQKEGFEKTIRAEIYKEFWRELEAIEQGKA